MARQPLVSREQVKATLRQNAPTLSTKELAAKFAQENKQAQLDKATRKKEESLRLEENLKRSRYSKASCSN